VEAVLFFLKVLFYLLVVAPICTMLHEMRHAGMILLLTRQKVTFQFGARGTKWEIRLGRLTIIFYLEPGLSFCIYRLENKAGLSLYQDLWITLGGPLASLLFTILFGSFYWRSGGADLWMWSTVINLFNFLNTCLPWRYPKWQGIQAGLPSDGRQVVELLKNSRKAGNKPSV
jgi:hypothetical protein